MIRRDLEKPVDVTALTERGPPRGAGLSLLAMSVITMIILVLAVAFVWIKADQNLKKQARESPQPTASSSR